MPKVSHVDVADLRFSSSEFISMLGISLSTLKRWERTGLFTPGRFPNGTKFYTTAHLEICLGHGHTDDSYRVFLAGRIRIHVAAGYSTQDALRHANAEWQATRPLDSASSGTKKTQTLDEVAEIPTPNSQLPTP